MVENSMVKTHRTRGVADDSDGENTENQPIDIPETVAEEVPAGLLESLETWHRELSTIVLQYEHAPTRWRQIRQQFNYATPPVQSPLEIGVAIVSILGSAVSKWPATSELPTSFRVRAKLQGSTGERWRVHRLCVEIGAGEVVVLDGDGTSEGGSNPNTISLAVLDRCASITVQCLEGVAKAVERIVHIGDAVGKMAEASANLAHRSAEGMADLVRAQTEREQAAAESAYDVEKMREVAELAKAVAPRIIEVWAAKASAASKANAQSIMSRVHEMTRVSIDWNGFVRILTEDERSLVVRLLGSNDDDTARAILGALRDRLNADLARSSELIDAAQRLLGDQAVAILAGLLA